MALSCPESSSELRWSNLSVFTKETKHSPSKQILHNCKGVVRPGEFLAIMGPSGAGKTTLLNCLSSKYQNNTIQSAGQVLLNNHPISSIDYKSIIGFVPQDDILLESMTVSETFDFSASLTMNLSKPERQAKVKQLIEELALTGCADSMIGGKVIRGISGGERKRVSIGVELIFDPPVLFLDEPTTGLDSFNALNIIELLSNLAKRKQSAIIATIHQPSSRIFMKFDRLLLLSSGFTVYIGKADQAINFFNEMNFPIKENYNPADHFIEVLCNERLKNKDFLNKIVDKGMKCSFVESVMDEPKSHHKVSWVLSLCYLIGRDIRYMFRNPIIIKGQVLKLIVVLSMCCMTFANLGTGIYEMNDRYGALFLLSNNVIMDSVLSTAPVFQRHKEVFQREYFGRKYGPFPFLMSFILTRLPNDMIISIGLYGFSYYIIGFNPDITHFFSMLLIAFLASFSAGSYGLLVSVIAPSMEAASALAPLFIVPFMLSGGYIVSYDKIPDWFLIQYLSPFRYVFETTARIDIKNNPDINSQIADIAIDNLKIPDGYNKAIFILITLGVGIKVLCVILLRFMCRKI